MGLVVLHVFVALTCWALAEIAQSQGDDADPPSAFTDVYFLRGTSVVLLLGLLPAWRGRWGLWLASILAPLVLDLMVVLAD